MSFTHATLTYKARRFPLALNVFQRDVLATQLYQELTFGFLASLIILKNESKRKYDNVFISYDGANVAHEVEAGQTIELRPTGTNHLFLRAEEGGYNIRVNAS